MSVSTSKIWTIIQHEYLTKVKSKGFIISTILGPIFLILIIVIPTLVTALSSETTVRKVVILDESNCIAEKLLKQDSVMFLLMNLSEKELQDKIRNNEIDAYLLIDKDVLNNGKATIYSKGGGGIGFIGSIKNSLKSVLLEQRLINAGSDTVILSIVNKGIELETKKITEKGEESDYTVTYAVLGYILGFVIYIMMIMYGSFVMRGVIEEKANRIIEIIASSVRPFEIMMGKVIGIGAIGLTQVAFWVIIAIILFSLGVPLLNNLVSSPEIIGQPEDLNKMQEITNYIPTSIPLMLIIGFIFYFLAGYFIYATLFAAVGSAVDQESDAQQLSTPITFAIIIPILFVGNVISNPDGTLAVVLSLIPFFTPILMIVRVAATSVPLWQILLSIILLIVTFLISLKIAAKIYRIGILMYGKKIKFKELIKWIKIPA